MVTGGRGRIWPRFDANIPGLLLVLIANLVMWLLVFQLARRIDGGTAAADDETSFEYYCGFPSSSPWKIDNQSN